ncbi:MAG: NAD(P)(+) transhydrogenase (Re/Si-specific) subunit alpha, partial [Alphaproteobacteria bacterium]|nr:NAD(P)(+) transhydrogenase (Re/Si-specific) subunit alpha [Alphaproteobacteria bacterium]
MKIAIVKERAAGETRVAVSPDTVKKIIGLGHSVTIEAGAGSDSSFPDAHFTAAGATIAASAAEALSGADLLLKVRAPTPDELAALRPGAGVVGLLNPYNEKAFVQTLAERGVAALAMEFVPRITRAQ